MPKLAELDESYWQCNPVKLQASHQSFLNMHRKSGEYDVAGLKFVCPPNIYHPNEFGSTRFALRGLFSELSRWGQRILEVGTGSGAIGICLAAAGREVTMLDIDPVAVACATDNAALNNIKVTVAQSDLFSAVSGQKYDMIMFNIPLLDKMIEEPMELMACDSMGELYIRFMDQAKHYLTPGGYVCVSVANIGNRKAILEGLSNYTDFIVHSEYYAGVNEWRWLLAAQPL